MSGHDGQTVGYVRVSTTDQNPARQLEAIGQVDRLFAEKISARTTDRPQLQAMLGYVRSGDVVKVKSPDRLARSTTDLLALVNQLKDKDVQIQFIDQPALNTDSPQGEFMLTILGAVAQLERATIKERQAEGIALAKARGVYNRTPKLSADQIDTARRRIANGVTKSRVARDLGVSRQTLYTALSGQGRYQH
ncbi:recombinase family protein [Propionibacterium freudenreichii]|uniref:recombinase family protein n=1 Tax=Propionibacterium freudenreichii TaxID=1744 RepID=UPI0005436335|nr:recombinase family protein [Propionibacterium freudenreichii]AJQ90057.1 Transposon Tn21 resolvase [Propionibacterium freudenreichii subsp. freudenreichii]MDK9302557.1 recombinase family protein [Propionibacterium freudenreichii]MDK9322205.1 recombinase family protein [Propionibacterium freudenreichii]MDK9324372.1 recombinase family protein [Propionibacterium freudenreichii]MDK9343129.1 recombinase family protein [Propionibacterium freudenreichii]